MKTTIGDRLAIARDVGLMALPLVAFLLGLLLLLSGCVGTTDLANSRCASAGLAGDPHCLLVESESIKTRRMVGFGNLIALQHSLQAQQPAYATPQSCVIVPARGAVRSPYAYCY